MKKIAASLLAVTTAALLSTGASARTIVDDWASVQVPPPPALQEVHADPKTTALLVLDFMNSNCGAHPRCAATVPAVAGLIATAKALHMPVIYSITRNKTAADVVKPLTPSADTPVIVPSMGPDKFFKTNLDEMLKRAGIKTVIVTGTSAEGAVIATASEAAYRGLKVILPVDGMSSVDPVGEQTTLWILANGPTTSTATTPTSIAQIHIDGP